MLSRMAPVTDQGRIVYDAGGSGLSEHGVHHFHGLLIDAYRSLVGDPAAASTEPASPVYV
jgi:carnitine monooxygenase subunit